jgi:shikimate kinase
MNDVILIAGIPASGKTSFGDYLRDAKHFLHVDLEAPDECFISILDESVRVGRVEVFLDVLKQNATRVVLTWGFHPGDFNIIQALKAAEVELWWFDADEDAARERFLARGTVPLASFEAQLSRIRAAREQIETCFAPRIIQTLRADGSFLSCEEIFDAIAAVPVP